MERGQPAHRTSSSAPSEARRWAGLRNLREPDVRTQLQDHLPQLRVHERLLGSVNRRRTNQAGLRPVWPGLVQTLTTGLALMVLAGSCLNTGSRADAMPTPELPAPTPTVLPTEPTPYPSPQPGVEYRRMPPTMDFNVSLEREVDDPYPTLSLSYRPYNSCSIPMENRIEWQSEKVLVEAYQMVGFPENGCPRGEITHVHQSVPLGRFTDGDEIYVNGELLFQATDFAFCYDFSYGGCPRGCVRVCTSSNCGGSVCTADCDGPDSCRPPYWDLRHYERKVRIGDNPRQSTLW